MKSSFKKRPGSQIELEVSLEPKEFLTYWEQEEQTALAKVEVPGFRPGGAPPKLARKAVNPEALFDHAAREAIHHSLEEVTEKENWIIVSQPQIEVIEATPLEKKEASEKTGFRYRATFAVFPDISLGNYKKIASEIMKERRAIVVPPEEIEKTLEWIRASRAAITKVARGAQKGDLVEADMLFVEDQRTWIARVLFELRRCLMWSDLGFE